MFESFSLTFSKIFQTVKSDLLHSPDTPTRGQAFENLKLLRSQVLIDEFEFTETCENYTRNEWRRLKDNLVLVEKAEKESDVLNIFADSVGVIKLLRSSPLETSGEDDSRKNMEQIMETILLKVSHHNTIFRSDVKIENFGLEFFRKVSLLAVDVQYDCKFLSKLKHLYSVQFVKEKLKFNFDLILKEISEHRDSIDSTIGAIRL
jgi:hypothetical protein